MSCMHVLGETTMLPTVKASNTYTGSDAGKYLLPPGAVAGGGAVLINSSERPSLHCTVSRGGSFEVRWGATYCRVWGEASRRETVSFGSSLMQLLRDYGRGSSERHMEQSVIAPLNKIRR